MGKEEGISESSGNPGTGLHRGTSDIRGRERFMMVIRSFEIDRDFEYISKWISDERTHAMWCA
ncbi:MAG: hypothetical protein ILP13_00205, partial [Lachnospiraceae bacterium]|nr:hypothetical protein [Lachnospiraceae bacterium]